MCLIAARCPGALRSGASALHYARGVSLAVQLLVLVHLVGFAALLGGALAQVRAVEPDVSGAMLWGGWTLLATGVALVVLEVVGSGPDRWWPLVVKLAVSLFLVLLLARNRRYRSIPRGLLSLIGVLTLLDAALGVLWPSAMGQ